MTFSNLGEIISQLSLSQLLLWLTVVVGVSASLQLTAPNQAKYPGPRWWGASTIPSTLSSVRGRLPWDIAALHAQYGHVVRVAPSELSYTTATAWADIYGPRYSTGGEMPKHRSPDSWEESFGKLNMTHATVEDHARMRRIINHGFSDKALRDIEPIVQRYIGLLIERLGEKTDRGEVVDVVAWFNFLTFDLTGELAFSDSFNCLEKGEYHPWISMIFNNLKLMVYSNAAKTVPGLTKLLMSITPKEVLEQGIAHMRLVIDQANKRLAATPSRPDIMSYVINGNGKDGGMTTEEIQANTYVLIIAGSETTATLLSGCLFLVLTHREVYQRLVTEIRSTFTAVSEITYATVSALEFLPAVLFESLRRYPPVPGSLAREVPPPGAMIDGRHVPAGTAVSVHTWAANHSEKNFTDPMSFRPERWTDEGSEKYGNDVREACQSFSFGPRNCVGKTLAQMEMRLVLARMLWTYNVEIVEGQSSWLDQRVFLLYEKPPLKVMLTRRS